MCWYNLAAMPSPQGGGKCASVEMLAQISSPNQWLLPIMYYLYARQCLFPGNNEVCYCDCDGFLVQRKAWLVNWVIWTSHFAFTHLITVVERYSQVSFPVTLMTQENWLFQYCSHRLVVVCKVQPGLNCEAVVCVGCLSTMKPLAWCVLHFPSVCGKEWPHCPEVTKESKST